MVHAWKSRLVGAFVAFCCVLAAARAARANPVGTAFSGPTDGDGAALYWNPAALSLMKGTNLYGVFNVVLAHAGYQRTGNDIQTGMPFGRVNFFAPKPEPVIAIVTDAAHPRLRLALGVTLPLVLGSGWPETYTPPGSNTSVLGPTRYYATNSQFINGYLQAAASFKFNDYVSIGGGPNLTLTLLNTSQHLDLANQLVSMPPLKGTLPVCQAIPCETAAFSALNTISGNAIGFGGSVGILLTPTKWLRVGAGYNSPVRQNLSVQIKVDTAKLESFITKYLPSGFTGLGLNGSGNLSLTVPQQFHAAIAADVTPQFELSAGMEWMDLSATSVFSATITQKGSMFLPDKQDAAVVRDDQYTFWGRGVYKLGDRWRFALRVEYLPNTAPDRFASAADVDWNKIDISIGAEYRFGRSRIGATYSHIFAFDHVITSSVFSNLSSSPFNKPDPSGTYTFWGDRMGLNFDYTF